MRHLSDEKAEKPCAVGKDLRIATAVHVHVYVNVYVDVHVDVDVDVYVDVDVDVNGLCRDYSAS